MSITIVVPTLNEEKFIGKLLQGLADQEYRSFEVVVVDGGSTDKTKDVVLGFSDKMDLQFFESHKKGVSAQRNFGAEKSKYEYLMFIDADGFVEPDFLAKTFDYIKTYPEIDMFSAWVLPLSHKRVYTALFYIFNVMVIDLMKNIYPFVSLGGFLFTKKSVFKDLGGYSTKHLVAEDKDLIERAFKKNYKIDIMRKPVVYTSIRRIEKDGLPKTIYNLGLAGWYQYMNGEVNEETMRAKKIKYEMNGGTNYKED